MFDNITEFVKDDLQKEIKTGCRVSIAAAYFYQKLKERLPNIAELRFLFTSPTFTTERAAKEKREFYIPQLMRKQCLCGSDFEVKRRDELAQKAIDIAKERGKRLRRITQLESRLAGEKQFKKLLEIKAEIKKLQVTLDILVVSNGY